MTATLDPVTLALVQSRLDHICHQMGWVMTRTARSPIFSQSHDFSCFIADARGILISQADGIPIHTGGGGFAASGCGATGCGSRPSFDQHAPRIIARASVRMSYRGITVR